MFWIFIALLSPLFHGFANILDNYLTNKIFKSVSSLVFLSAFFNFLFLPLIFLIEIPQLPTLEMLPFFILVGLIEVFYLYPYYKALQSEDTSVVSSLFELSKIFIPILAFLFLGEILSIKQYAGIFIIILSSLFLSINRHEKLFKFNKAFFLMAGCSLMLSAEAIIYKHIFNTNT